MAETQWYVLIEEAVGAGNMSTWTLTRTEPAGDSRADARRKAAELACTHREDNRWAPRPRRIYRVSEDQWLVDVTANEPFHFRVSVGELSGPGN